MAKRAPDLNKYINPHQLGGIDAYTIDDGDARGVRVLCVNTFGGLRYRVLVDRGLDIEQAFFHDQSLSFLTHRGVTPPSRALDRGLDWLKGFPGGLLTSCGPFNIGPPGVDQGEELGVHGAHSNTAATIESIVQPDPRRGELAMSITGRVRYGQLYGPCVELRRTISSPIATAAIDFTDEFFNFGNSDVPHAWLLHINFGFPLLDEGAEFCYDSEKIEPRDDPMSQQTFSSKANYKRVPAPLESHRGTGSAVAYLFPRADRNGQTTVGLLNRRLGIGVAVRYNAREFPRCGNWQHFGPYEYVSALEPMNGTVDGRAKDRERGLMDTLKAGERKVYRYRIEVVTGREEIKRLAQLNQRRK